MCRDGDIEIPKTGAHGNEIGNKNVLPFASRLKGWLAY
jgi:hypothetical protein